MKKDILKDLKEINNAFNQNIKYTESLEIEN